MVLRRAMCGRALYYGAGAALGFWDSPLGAGPRGPRVVGVRRRCAYTDLHAGRSLSRNR